MPSDIALKELDIRNTSAKGSALHFIPVLSLFHESVFRPLTVFDDGSSGPNGVTTPYPFV